MSNYSHVINGLIIIQLGFGTYAGYDLGGGSGAVVVATVVSLFGMTVQRLDTLIEQGRES